MSTAIVFFSTRDLFVIISVDLGPVIPLVEQGIVQDEVEEMRLVFKERRDYMANRINSIEGVSCTMPQGAFYIMMNIEKLIGKTIAGTVITGSDAFAEAFLNVAKVALVPGSGFGADKYLRWSYATSMENIKEGLDRLEKFLQQ